VLLNIKDRSISAGKHHEEYREILVAEVDTEKTTKPSNHTVNSVGTGTYSTDFTGKRSATSELFKPNRYRYPKDIRRQNFVKGCVNVMGFLLGL
jgi:hypothetical protein